MKRILLFLLALSLLCMGSCALAEQSISLEVVNEARLPLHEAEDPYIQLLRGTETAPTDGLPVLILPVKKNLQINTRILPQSVRNKKVTMEVDNADIVRVKGNSLTGLAAGETVLTIVSQADESVKLQYRVLVIQQVSRISLTAAAKSVAVGDTLDVTAAFQPENATLRQVTWTSGDERISVTTLDAIEAELLNMEEGHPAIYKSGFMSDDNGEPVSCYRTTALSEHVRYATEMLAR